MRFVALHLEQRLGLPLLKGSKRQKLVGIGLARWTQLKPIGFELNNVTNAKEYMNIILDIMFSNQIVLEYNKRLKTYEDQLLLKQMKEDIFNTKKCINNKEKIF